MTSVISPVIALLCLLLKYIGLPCSPGNVNPSCTRNGDILVCDGIPDQSVLDGEFQKLSDTSFTEFVLKNSKVDHLIASSLKTNNFQKILVMDSVISNIFDELPPNENQLTCFKLQNVIINNGFQVEFLKPLTKLEYLIITKTTIPMLGKEFNLNLSITIKRIDLLQTKTENIKYAFLAKPALEVINIQDDLLTSIDRFTFPYPADKLSVLTFDGNQITSLNNDQFQEMSALRVLSFAGNKISHVAEEVFGVIYDQLQTLDLSGNPIICDCSIQWITKKNSAGKTVNGECAAPPNLAGKKIVDLKSTDFASCPN